MTVEHVQEAVYPTLAYDHAILHSGFGHIILVSC